MRTDPIKSTAHIRTLRASAQKHSGNNVDEYEGGMTYVTAYNFW